MPSTVLNGACGRSMTMLELWSYSRSSSFFKTEACLRVLHSRHYAESSLVNRTQSRIGRLIQTDSSVQKAETVILVD